MDKNMILFLGKKLVAFAVSMFVLSLTVFYVARFAPGDPLVSYYGDRVEKMSQEEREKAREKNEVLIIQGMGAAIALGEATAEAVQRIPDAHCNGDMHAALEYARKVKHEHKEFLTEQSVQALY